MANQYSWDSLGILKGDQATNDSAAYSGGYDRNNASADTVFSDTTINPNSNDNSNNNDSNFDMWQNPTDNNTTQPSNSFDFSSRSSSTPNDDAYFANKDANMSFGDKIGGFFSNLFSNPSTQKVDEVQNYQYNPSSLADSLNNIGKNFQYNQPNNDFNSGFNTSNQDNTPSYNYTPTGGTGIDDSNIDTGIFTPITRAENDFMNSKLAQDFANSDIGKFLNTGSRAAANAATFNTGLADDSKATPTGNSVADWLANMGGTGIGLAVNPEGIGSIGEGLDKVIGQPVEDYISNPIRDYVANKLGTDTIDELSTPVYNALQYGLQANKTGAEWAALTGAQDAINSGNPNQPQQNYSDIANGLLDSYLSGAVFGMGAKGLNEEVMPRIANIQERQMLNNQGFQEVTPDSGIWYKNNTAQQFVPDDATGTTGHYETVAAQPTLYYEQVPYRGEMIPKWTVKLNEAMDNAKNADDAYNTMQDFYNGVHQNTDNLLNAENPVSQPSDNIQEQSINNPTQQEVITPENNNTVQSQENNVQTVPYTEENTQSNTNTPIENTPSQNVPKANLSTYGEVNVIKDDGKNVTVQTSNGDEIPMSKGTFNILSSINGNDVKADAQPYNQLQKPTMTQVKNTSQYSDDFINNRMKTLTDTTNKLIQDNGGITPQIQNKLNNIGAEFNKLLQIKNERQQSQQPQIENNAQITPQVAETTPSNTNAPVKTESFDKVNPELLADTKANTEPIREIKQPEKAIETPIANKKAKELGYSDSIIKDFDNLLFEGRSIRQKKNGEVSTEGFDEKDISGVQYPLARIDNVSEVIKELRKSKGTKGIIDKIYNSGVSDNPRFIDVSTAERLLKLVPTMSKNKRFMDTLATSKRIKAAGFEDANSLKVALRKVYKPEIDYIKQSQEIKQVNQLNTPVTETPSQNAPKEQLSHMATDNQVILNHNGRLDAGTITKTNNDGTVEVQRPEGDYVLAKKNGATYKTIQSEPTPKEQIPIDDRNNQNVGDRSIKAYQYLHPELKSYIQDEAKAMLKEFKDTQRHEKYGIDKSGTQSGWSDPRITSDDIKYLRDNVKMDYAKIEKGLKALIEDNGAENIADAKKVELVIDHRLSNVYKDFKTGHDVEPNKDYIAKKNEIEGTKEVASTIEENKHLYSSNENSNNHILNTDSNDLGNKKMPNVLDKYKGNTEPPKGSNESERWQPKEVKSIDIKKTFQTATGVFSPKTRDAIMEARSNLVTNYNANPDKVIQELETTKANINTKIKTWGGLKKESILLQNQINHGVPTEYNWVGMSNISNWKASGSKVEDIQQFVKSVINEYGPRSGEEASKELLRTFLAVDTRLNYKDLNVIIKNIAEKQVKGRYTNNTKTITLDNTFIDTVAHEVGHYLDHKWGTGITALTEFKTPTKTQSYNDWLDSLGKYEKNSIANETEGKWKYKTLKFMQDITKDASKTNDYLSKPNEIFARFTERFVAWTHEQAGIKYETHYNDKFQTSDFVRFARLLQERASIDAQLVEKNTLEVTNDKSLKFTEDKNGNYNYKDYQIKQNNDDMVPTWDIYKSGKLIDNKMYLEDAQDKVINDQRSFVEDGGKRNQQQVKEVIQSKENQQKETKDNNTLSEIKHLYSNKDKGGMELATKAINSTSELENRIRESEGTVSGNGIKTIGLSFTKELTHQGYVELRGRSVKNIKDLAVMAQIFRNPQYETFRIIYTKGKEIVGHEAMTSRIPGSTVAFLKDKGTAIREMRNRMNRLNADGYYLLHNHPSGEPKPSTSDLKTTKFYKDNIKGFKGHVIINSNKYAAITELSKDWKDILGTDFDSNIHDLNLKEDKLLNPSIDHPLLGEKINNAEKLAQISKELQLDKKQSAVFYMDSQLKTRAIQEIPSKMLGNEKALTDYLRGRMKEFGSNSIFINVNGDEHTPALVNLIKKGYVTDAIVNNDESTISLRNDMGITPKIDNSKWMGASINKGLRVNENKVNEANENYATNNKDILAAKKVAEYVLNPKNKLKNDPIKDFVDNLYKFRTQSGKMNPLHYTIETMLDKAGHEAEIQKAYDLTRSKYENNRLALKALDNKFGGIVEKPFFDIFNQPKKFEKVKNDGIQKSALPDIKDTKYIGKPLDVNIMNTDKGTGKDLRQGYAGRLNQIEITGNHLKDDITKALKNNPLDLAAIRQYSQWENNLEGLQANVNDPRSNDFLDKKYTEGTGAKQIVHPFTYRDIMNRALELSKDMPENYKKALDDGRQYYDERGNYLKDYGVIHTVRENYNNTLYNNENAERGFKVDGGSKNKISTATGHAKAKVYPTDFEAMANGKIPLTLDYAKLIAIYGHEIATPMVNAELGGVLKNEGLGKYLGSDEERKKDEVKIPGLSKFENIKGEDGKMHRIERPFVMLEDMYKPLRALFDPDQLAKYDFITKLKAFQGVIKTADLALSTFHHITLPIQLLNYNRGGIDFIRYASSVFKKASDSEFHQWESEWVRDDLVTTGIDDTKEILKVLEGNKEFADYLKKVPGLKQAISLNDKSTRLLFKSMQRYFKVTTAQKEYVNWLSKHPNATNAEITKARRSIATAVNFGYGGLNWKAMGIDKTCLSLGRLMTLAFDWTSSTVGSFAQSFAKSPGGNLTRAGLFWGFIVATAITQLWNRANTGHFTDKNPRGHEWEVQLGPDTYFSLYRSFPGELAKWISDVAQQGLAVGTGKYFQGKGSPLARTALGLFATNKDYYGKALSDPKKSTLQNTLHQLQFAAENLGPLPFGLNSIIKYFENGNVTIPGAIGVGIGATRFSPSKVDVNSPYYVPGSESKGNLIQEGENKINQWINGGVNPDDVMQQMKDQKTQQTTNNKNLRTDLGNALKNGQNPNDIFDQYNVPQKSRNAILNGVKRSLSNTQSQGQNSSMINQYNSMSTANQQKFYNNASPDIQSQLPKPGTGKRKGASNTPMQFGN